MDLDDGRTLLEARILAEGPADWGQEILSMPGVSAVERLAESRGSERLRVVHRHPPLLSLFREFQLMHRFPFPVEKGVATWVMAGPEARVRPFLSRLTKAIPGTRVESVRHDEGNQEDVLTKRQREIFRRALDAGYFEVPRRTTLSDLARQMGMAISSLSEALAIVERKLLAEPRAS